MTPRTIAAAAAILALALPAQAQPKDDTVSVAETLSLSQAPYYIAIEKGYFAAEHITVNADSQRGAQDTVAMLATGRLDVSLGAVSAGFFNAQNHGLDLRAVAALGIQPSPIVSSPSIARKDLWDSGAIKSGADFRGRKIAVNVQGAFPEYLLTLILDKYSMTLKDVDETVLGFPQQVIALQNKALDVALPPEPFPATAIAMGVAARVVPEQSVGAGDITTMVFFSGRFMRERPEVSKRFLHAILRAAHETQGNYNKNPELAAMLAHATKLKQDAVENSVATAFDPDLDIAKYEDSLRRQEAVYMKLGRLDYATPLPMDRLVDASLVHQAAASLK